MQCIRDLNRMQPHLQDTDPYSGGVTSGRSAAPDAQSVAQNTEAHTRATATADGAEPTLSQLHKCGRKHTGTPALSVPQSPSPLQLQLPSSAPLPPCPAPHVWYAAPPTALNLGAYPYATAASSPSPSQFTGTHHTPSSGLPSSSAHLGWYPMPATYPSAMYAHGSSPAYWPYGHFYSQPPHPQ
ncbi:hypothetical protein EI94DRAFT_1710703 [Lactarius quietus]|nr:hypothetical protein EI94DRAFT_1710703 [Lactarius quietus]